MPAEPLVDPDEVDGSGSLIEAVLMEGGSGLEPLSGVNGGEKRPSRLAGGGDTLSEVPFTATVGLSELLSKKLEWENHIFKTSRKYEENVSVYYVATILIILSSYLIVAPMRDVF